MLALCTACAQGRHQGIKKQAAFDVRDLRGYVALCKTVIPQGYGEPIAASDPVDNSYFDDAIFAGDSRIAGLSELYVLADTSARIYGSVSLDVNKAEILKVFTLDDGSAGTMIEAIAQAEAGKIYLSFGLNELGWYVLDVFKEQYLSLINQIKAVQPHAQIYLLDVYNFAKQREYENDYTTLDKVKLMNEAIKEVAVTAQVNLVHSNAMLDSDDTYLPKEWSSDGYHLNSEGFDAWLTMVKTHVNKGEVLYEIQPCND